MTKAEERTLTRLLNTITWPVSPDVFNALLGAMPTVAIELQVITERGHVVLLPRPQNDPFFAGKIHGPGTVMRRGDTEGNALRRALGELGDAHVTTPEFIDRIHVPMGYGHMQCVRGQEIGLLFGVEILYPIPINLMRHIYCPKQLPENVIPFHRPMIVRAIEWWKKKYKSI